MQGHGNKITRMGQKAWDEFTTLIHSILSKTKVNDISLSFVFLAHKLPLEMDKPAVIDYTKEVLPRVIDLEAGIIDADTAKVVPEKITFEILDQPMLLKSQVQKIDVFQEKKDIKLHDVFPLECKEIKNVDPISKMIKEPLTVTGLRRKKIRINMKDCSMSRSVKVSIDTLRVLVKPTVFKKSSFSEFDKKEKISFIDALIAKSGSKIDNLVLEGVYQPVALHRVNRVRFDKKTGNLLVFYNAQKKRTQLARVIIGRDKTNPQKTIMTALPLK